MIKAASPTERSAHVASTADDVGLTLRVETPENVVLEYQLAGPAARVLAYGIDFLIRMAILFIVSMVMFNVFALVSVGATLGTFLVITFLVTWSYYVVCEWFFQGRTLGKRAMGLRVIQDLGSPITFWSALLRNLLRPADALPWLAQVAGAGLGFYGVGLISMLSTKKLQRLGDLAAGTVVINDRTVVLPREPLILERIQPLDRQDVGSFTPSPRLLAKIEEFLGRRYVLTHERGHALATVLAAALAERLEFRGESRLVQQYPMAFLARVYVTFQREAEEDEDEGDFDFEPRDAPPRRARRYVDAGGRR